jgi:hypothetical protein
MKKYFIELINSSLCFHMTVRFGLEKSFKQKALEFKNHTELILNLKDFNFTTQFSYLLAFNTSGRSVGFKG